MSKKRSNDASDPTTHRLSCLPRPDVSQAVEVAFPCLGSALSGRKRAQWPTQLLTPAFCDCLDARRAAPRVTLTIRASWDAHAGEVVDPLAGIADEERGQALGFPAEIQDMRST